MEINLLIDQLTQIGQRGSTLPLEIRSCIKSLVTLSHIVIASWHQTNYGGAIKHKINEIYNSLFRRINFQNA